jgi:hypothetical protein
MMPFKIYYGKCGIILIESNEYKIIKEYVKHYIQCFQIFGGQNLKNLK